MKDALLEVLDDDSLQSAIQQEAAQFRSAGFAEPKRLGFGFFYSNDTRWDMMGYWFPCFWALFTLGRCLQLEFMLFPTWKLRWNPQYGASRIGVLCDSDKNTIFGKSSYVLQQNPFHYHPFSIAFSTETREITVVFVASSWFRGRSFTTRQLDLPSGRWREVVPHETVPRRGRWGGFLHHGTSMECPTSIKQLVGGDWKCGWILWFMVDITIVNGDYNGS